MCPKRMRGGEEEVRSERSWGQDVSDSTGHGRDRGSTMN